MTTPSAERVGVRGSDAREKLQRPSPSPLQGEVSLFHLRQIQRAIDQRAGALEIEIAVKVLLRRE
jgi:hypothetical protein